MIEFCSNTWSNFLEWKEECVDQASDWLDHNWDYYTQERGVSRGLPIAMISSIAASYLFQCAKPSSAGIFGAVNYITLTSLLEVIRARHYIDTTKACVILGISGAISLAFMQTVCKTAMTNQTAIILATAAFAGQIARSFGMPEE